MSLLPYLNAEYKQYIPAEHASILYESKNPAIIMNLLTWIETFGIALVIDWINKTKNNPNLNLIYDAPFVADIETMVKSNDENFFIKIEGMKLDGVKCRRCGGIEVEAMSKQTQSGDEEIGAFAQCQSCLFNWRM
jgi:DNA-directed RNA polymerase subunit M/transcription elongation factor TFIIS